MIAAGATDDNLGDPPMPFLYVVLQLALALAAAIGASVLLRWRRGWRFAVGGLALGVIGFGLALEGRGWLATRLAGWPDLVFFTDWTLAGVAVLLALLWEQSRTAFARRRAVLLTPIALGFALWSYAWYFAPLPADLRGRPDPRGFCRQTTPDSCSAAAAVTLLAQHGIAATEAEMARLCLTRRGLGTPPLGLWRGLALKSRARGWRPEYRRLNGWRELATLSGPAIASVGLSPLASEAVRRRLAKGGWRPGVRHAVVLLGFREDEGRLAVWDPSVGLEIWKAAELEELWDRRVLLLTGDSGPRAALRRPPVEGHNEPSTD